MGFLTRYKDPVPQNAFAPHLRVGETLGPWAHGVKSPHPMVSLLLGPIAQVLLTKEYLIGRTDRRVIVLRVKGKKAKVMEVTEYGLDESTPVTVEVLKAFDRVTIEDPERPLEATFNPVTAPDNLEHAREIVAALRARVPTEVAA